MEEAEGIEFEEVDDWFVVLEADVVGELLESFFEELVLFLLEDIGHIQLLQFFIGKVDKKLLEGVDLKHFKAEDVQQPDALAETLVTFIQVHFLQLNLLVQLAHQIQEGLFVEVLGEGVLESHCFLVFEGRVDHVAPDLPRLELETLKKTRLFQAEQRGHVAEVLFVGYYGHLLVVFGEFFAEGQIAKVENRGNNAEDAVGFIGVEVALEFLLHFKVLLLIADAPDIEHARLIDVFILVNRLGEQELLLLLCACPLQEIIENVVVPFAFPHRYDAALFQQVTDNECALDVGLAFTVQQ